MNTKKRKIFKRIGAGLMLGLSLLGFGSQTTKGQSKLMPKKMRHIRKDDQESMIKEDQELMNTIEKEASTALKQQQNIQQKEQQDMQTNLSKSQIFLRYSALAVWAIGISLFFTSLVFNAPFSLGKKFMSSLPGNPHLASMSLNKNGEIENNEIGIDLKVNSDKDEVHLIKAVIEYSDNDLLLQNYDLISDQINRVYLNEKDNEGIKKVIFTMESNGEVFNEEGVIKFNFLQRKESGKIEINLLEDESLILNRKPEKTENILGETEGVSVFVQ